MTDVPVYVLTRGNRSYVGKATQRSYGRVGNGMVILVDPADLCADKKHLRAAEGVDADAVTTAAALGRKVLQRRQSIGGSPLVPPPATPRRVLSRTEILARAQAAWTEVVGGM